MTNKNRGNVLVVLQFGLLAALGFAPALPLWQSSLLERQLSLFLAIAGVSILALGAINLGKSLTANPVPLEKAVLKTSGVYALVRHPIYLGLLLLGAAIVLQSGSWLHILLYACLIALLSIKARFEEKLLLEKYADYKDYAARVGRMLPIIGRLR